MSATRIAAAAGCALALLGGGCSQPAAPEAAAGEWRSYGGDPGGSKYSPLSQIDAGNFDRLEPVWRWESAAARFKRRLDRGPRAQRFPVNIADFQLTPLMVGGVLYGITSIGQLFALDAGTGEELWLHDPESYRSRTDLFSFLLPKHRGVTYWRDGDDERIFVPTIDAYLLAVDARTGVPVESFGAKGRVDLLENLRGPAPERLQGYFQSSPAALYRDTLIVGSSMTDRPKSRRATPGDVRGYDARTGALRWVFHTVPAEGEPGSETWEDESWRYSGAANAWGPMVVDEELGAVYLSTGTPTNDFYGGHRKGANLYAETLLCLDAETGALRWHFQLVRHGLWDYDPGAPANLVDITVDGRAIRAVAQVTKQGFTFVLDRVTGEPVWPIEDRPVPASDVPGERAAATQPFPVKPPPFERQGALEEHLLDYTPELRAGALEVFRRYETGPLFTPPSLRGTLILPGPSGGANWRGAGFDPETGILYVPSITLPAVVSVTEGKAAGTDFDYATDRSQPLWFPEDEPPGEALPLFQPPYTRITALDLNTGELVWQVPVGDGPRDHPRLRELELPPLGSGAPTGVLVTRTLLFAGEGAHPLLPVISRADLGEPLFRAYDKADGHVVGELRAPARIRGVPMTYLHEGRQYLILAVGDPKRWTGLVALALPDAPAG